MAIFKKGVVSFVCACVQFTRVCVRKCVRAFIVSFNSLYFDRSFARLFVCTFVSFRLFG